VRAALLTVDLQQDYLGRPGLSPPASILISKVTELLTGCRSLSIPVLHVRTLIRTDGSNRMPHWKRTNYWACVEGTPGAGPPLELNPLPSEQIIAKPYYSAFGNPDTNRILKDLNIDTVVIAGIYSHACVRATAMDAYQAGYDVWVADEAVASDNPLHAKVTRAYLAQRVCRFMPNREIIDRLGSIKGPRPQTINSEALPVGCVANNWIPVNGHVLWPRHNPAQWDAVLATVPIGQSVDIELAVSAASESQTSWSQKPPRERATYLSAWASLLTERREECVALMAKEIGKPLVHGHAEFRYAINLLDALIKRITGGETEDCEPGVRIRRRPLGVVGLITPWNNPLAIPVGKLAPALAYGNSVVWKPAPETPRLAMLIMDTLMHAEVPAGCVNMIQGNAETGQHLLTHPDIAAISFTGRVETGRMAASVCAANNKALQAELGGNNAALVMAGCDIEGSALELATAAFRFSGQSCTAPRRLIVERKIRVKFEKALINAISALRVGNPEYPDTYIGPLVSRMHREQIHSMVESAVREGGRILCGGRVPQEYEQGCWYEPTLIADVPHQAYAVQEESFGPLAILMEAQDIGEAMNICNDVPHGLVATLYSTDPTHKEYFLAEAQAGILRINNGIVSISPNAPFGGWKASAIGPPEHGRWDQEFYTRPQAVYET
jgi:acyl-CoA reductase-like NAD-dependent aldehyde dehydrogenase/nicotinamidase-related amidase